MRRVLLLACLVLMAWGCKKTEPSSTVAPPRVEPVNPVKTAEPTKADPAAPTVASSTALNGTPLRESQDGPWRVRGTLAPQEGPTGDKKSDEGGPRGGAMGPMGSGSASGLGLSGIGAGGGGSGHGRGLAAPPMAPGAARKAMRTADMDGLADEAAAMPKDPGAPPAGGSPLKAGSTDDNAEFSEFLKFFSSWSDRPETAGKADLLDVRDRRFIKVVDAQGRLVPTARVSVGDETADKAVWAATTYGDGRAPFYPRLSPGAAKLLVEASANGQRARASWDGASDVTLTLQADKPAAATIQLDVLFAIDTTGSMQDEIDRIKTSLAAVTQKLQGLKMEFDLRYSAVLFRDLGDAYVTRTYPFTSDLGAFAQALQAVNAGGGGDLPESVNQALAEAVRADWRPGAAKVLFLIGDAAPHMDYQGDVPYGQSLKAAVARGVRIHSVAASGLDPLGTFVWRQIAQFTRGRFIFIEYGGSVAATAESHGVTGAVKSNNLDDIIFEQIRDELAYWGKDGPAPAVAGQ